MMKNSMNHSMNHSNHYLVMLVIMIISGLLSTMNLYVDKLSDIRLSLNDLYMTLVMTSWMFLFMGIYNQDLDIIIYSIISLLASIWAIRSQFLISKNQYLQGMIPHHSMAIHMSKKLLEKDISIKSFLDNIINTQNTEIEFMKTQQ